MGFPDFDKGYILMFRCISCSLHITSDGNSPGSDQKRNLFLILQHNNLQVLPLKTGVAVLHAFLLVPPSGPGTPMSCTHPKL
jgi:hypothetical protein